VPHGALRYAAKDDDGYHGRARFVLTAKKVTGEQHFDGDIWLVVQLVDIPTAWVYLLA
jgi:hypothetical protein